MRPVISVRYFCAPRSTGGFGYPAVESFIVSSRLLSRHPPIGPSSSIAIAPVHVNATHATIATSRVIGTRSFLHQLAREPLDERLIGPARMPAKRDVEILVRKRDAIVRGREPVHV